MNNALQGQHVQLLSSGYTKEEQQVAGGSVVHDGGWHTMLHGEHLPLLGLHELLGSFECF